jgi:hypothetical protein
MAKHGFALFCLALALLVGAACSGVPGAADGGAGGGTAGVGGGGGTGGVGGGTAGGSGGGSGGDAGNLGDAGTMDAGCFPATGGSDGGANPGDGGLNQPPIAILNVCGTPLPCAPAINVSLAALPLGPNGTRLVQLCGTDSYDPPLNMRPLPFYQFALVTNPSTAVEFGVENNGMKASKGAVELRLDGAATGLYRVSLFVWDDMGQRSADGALLKVNVMQ